MRVNLKYFKQNGEVYDISGHYETEYIKSNDIYREIEHMLKKGILPGIYGVTNSIVLVDIPEHLHNKLKLIGLNLVNGISVGGDMNGHIINGNNNSVSI